MEDKEEKIQFIKNDLPSLMKLSKEKVKSDNVKAFIEEIEELINNDEIISQGILDELVEKHHLF